MTGEVVHLNTGKRWRVEIEWRTQSGFKVEYHEVEELDDLQSLLEHGPDWNCLKKITVFYARPSKDSPQTIEEYEAQFLTTKAEA